MRRMDFELLAADGDTATWLVRINHLKSPTVGNYIRLIKDSFNYPDYIASPMKYIYIYKNGLRVGKCVFDKKEAVEWEGSPKEIWPAKVQMCELIVNKNTIENKKYVFKIYIKDGTDPVFAFIHPFPKYPLLAQDMVPVGVQYDFVD